MTEMTELQKLLKKANDECYTWHNLHQCLTCQHCRIYIDDGHIPHKMICVKEHDIPKKGLRECEDYDGDLEEQEREE